MTFFEKLNILLNDINDFILLMNSSSSVKENKIILISGLPRSGTTWFGSMLNTRGNIVFHEPFIKKTMLWNWSENIKNGENISSINDTYEEIISNNDWSRYQKKTNNKFLRILFLHKRIKKDNYNIIIKDPSICYFIDYFENLEFSNIVVIYRNPLSVVGSVFKNGWDPTERLIRIKLHPNIDISQNDEIKKLLDNLEKLDLVQKIALQTGILQFLLQKKSKGKIIVKYEDYALDPVAKFKDLIEQLQLEYSDEVELYHKKLSSSKKDTYTRHDVVRKSDDFIEIYNKYLSDSQIKEVKRIYSLCNPNPIIKYF